MQDALTVKQWLENGVCRITVLQVRLTHEERQAFNDVLTAFIAPTSACPVPVVKVETTQENPCQQRETKPLDSSGNTPATLVVQSDICQSSTTTQRQGKVDNMCLPYGTSTTRPGQTC